MSMLAEPRRKVRYNINPNGNTWANDSNAFGKKMLEKMGWSNGKGLGANLDGMTTHIKVSHKSDQKGMGFTDRNDQWTEHEDNFSQLLKNLQSDGHQAIDSEKTDETRKSLELKSKSSKARVHYKKFTRGKDLSRYSSKDLANIFGRKTLEKKSLEDTSEEQEVKDVEMDDKKKSHGVETLEGGSMTDYFKKKMSQFKVNFNSKPKNEDDEEDIERPSFGLGFGGLGFGNTTNNEGFGFGFVASSKTLENETNSEESEEITKKDKKRKRKLEHDVDEVETCKKKKKKSKKEVDGLLNDAFQLSSDLPEDNCDSGVSLDENPFEVKVRTKKCKKNKNVQVEVEQSEEVDVKPSKGKKKDKVKHEYVVESLDEVTISKKKKKKQKKRDQGFENPNFNDTDASIQEIQEITSNPYEVIPKKKKDKKKKTEEGLENPNFEDNSFQTQENDKNAREDTKELESNLEIPINPYEVIPKEKKKKKKRKQSEEGLENPNFEDNSFPTQENDENVREDTEELESNLEIPINPYEVIPKEKKKKKKRKQSEEGFENPNCVATDEKTAENTENYEEITLKDKKLNKSTSEEITPIKKKSKKDEESFTHEEITEVAEEPIKKKNKKKKNKEELVESVEDLSTPTKKQKKNKQTTLSDPPLDVAGGTDYGITDDLIMNISSTEPKKQKKNKMDATASGDVTPLNNSVNNFGITDDLIMNITSTEPKPILTTPHSAKNRLKRRKSVRIDESLNQERIIPNILQQKQMALEGKVSFDVDSVGIANPSFNIQADDKGFYDSNLEVNAEKNVGISNPGFRNVQEEIEDVQRSLDSYQAEVENDINEEKVTAKVQQQEETADGAGVGYRFVGTVSALDKHVRLENGHVGLAFRNANLTPTINHYEMATNMAKKSFSHLVKGDVEMAFKDTNLHTIKGYATVEALNKRKQMVVPTVVAPQNHSTNLRKIEMFTRLTERRNMKMAVRRGLVKP